MPCSSSAVLPRFLLHPRPTTPDRHKGHPGSFTKPRRRLVTLSASLHIGVQDFIEAAQNKVILTAVLASGTGQLLKPFASVLRGGEFDLKMLYRSGGMPSTHTASVVAVAMCLGLERGFSDSIFGMTAVFAAIVMYDSQGVRYQVGQHAKTLNRFKDVRDQTILYRGKKAIDRGVRNFSLNSEPASSITVPENTKSISLDANQDPPHAVSVLPNTSDRTNTVTTPSVINVQEEEETSLESLNFVPLNEYVGHTTLEVLVGAVFGVFVTLAVESWIFP